VITLVRSLNDGSSGGNITPQQPLPVVMESGGDVKKPEKGAKQEWRQLFKNEKKKLEP
jgi:hypothetical protein